MEAHITQTAAMTNAGHTMMTIPAFCVAGAAQPAAYKCIRAKKKPFCDMRTADGEEDGALFCRRVARAIWDRRPVVLRTLLSAHRDCFDSLGYPEHPADPSFQGSWLSLALRTPPRPCLGTLALLLMHGADPLQRSSADDGDCAFLELRSHYFEQDRARFHFMTVLLNTRRQHAYSDAAPSAARDPFWVSLQRQFPAIPRPDGLLPPCFDPKYGEFRRHTPLTYAVRHGEVECVRLLLHQRRVRPHLMIEGQMRGPAVWEAVRALEHAQDDGLQARVDGCVEVLQELLLLGANPRAYAGEFPRVWPSVRSMLDPASYATGGTAAYAAEDDAAE